MSSRQHKEKRAGHGMVSLKSTKWKITDTFFDDFGIMKGQHVAGRPSSSKTLSTTRPSSRERNMGSTSGSVSRHSRTGGGGEISSANSEANCSTSSPSPTTSSHNASEMWWVPMSANRLAATPGSRACRTGLRDVETCMRLAHSSSWSSPSARKKTLMVLGSLKSSAVTKALKRKRCALIMRKRTLLLRATDNHANLRDNSRRVSTKAPPPPPETPVAAGHWAVPADPVTANHKHARGPAYHPAEGPRNRRKIHQFDCLVFSGAPPPAGRLTHAPAETRGMHRLHRVMELRRPPPPPRLELPRDADGTGRSTC